MHPALIALRRARDIQLSCMGYDMALRWGMLGSYMAMMDRGGSGGYGRRLIAQARMFPQVDPQRPAY